MLEVAKPAQATTTRKVEVPPEGTSAAAPPTTPTAEMTAKPQFNPAPANSLQIRLRFVITAGGCAVSVGSEGTATEATASSVISSMITAFSQYGRATFAPGSAIEH